MRQCKHIWQGAGLRQIAISPVIGSVRTITQDCKIIGRIIVKSFLSKPKKKLTSDYLERMTLGKSKKCLHTRGPDGIGH